MASKLAISKPALGMGCICFSQGIQWFPLLTFTFLRQLILGQVKACPEFPYTVIHGVIP